jgi:hypothetical protein
MPCENHGKLCDESCKDPNVDNGMMTKVWGPAGWLFLHSITFGYPYAINPDNPDHATKKEDYYKFFYYLGRVFPCKYCRESYQKFFKQVSPANHLNTRKDLTKWLYDVHNLVNDKLGVPECERPSFDDVNKTYEEFRAKCRAPTDEEVVERKAKGCIIPANGTPSRSVIKVVQFKPEDVIDPNNPNAHNFPKNAEFIVINKSTIKKVLFWALILVFVVLIGWCLYKSSEFRTFYRNRVSTLVPSWAKI